MQVDGAVAERAAQVTAGLTSAGDRIRAVFLEVATNVRNVQLNLGVGGYECNDAGVVLTNRYGDTRDKAVLLVSTLRAAGIDAWPAAVTAERVAPERQALLATVPTLRQFNRLLVAVPDGGGYRFLDPFLDDAAYGYLRWGRGNTALVVKDDGSGVRVPVPAFAVDENLAGRSMTVVVQPDGAASIHATCDLTGLLLVELHQMPRPDRIFIPIFVGNTVSKIFVGTIAIVQKCFVGIEGNQALRKVVIGTLPKHIDGDCLIVTDVASAGNSRTVHGITRSVSDCPKQVESDSTPDIRIIVRFECWLVESRFDNVKGVSPTHEDFLQIVHRPAFEIGEEFKGRKDFELHFSLGKFFSYLLPFLIDCRYNLRATALRTRHIALLRLL